MPQQIPASEKLKNVLLEAKNLATTNNHERVGSEHFLAALLTDKEISTILEKLGVDILKTDAAIKELFNKNGGQDLKPNEIVALNEVANDIYMLALQEAVLFKTAKPEVLPFHLLLAILKHAQNEAAYILNQENITYKELSAQFSTSGEIKSTTPSANVMKKKLTKISSKEPTPILDMHSKDFTKLAMEGKLDPIVGRAKEMRQVVQTLGRRTKNNPVLIGEPGVGKTAIAEGLAIKIINKDVPPNLFEKRVVSLDLTSLVSGTRYRGQFEERIKAIIDECIKAKDVILFIDEVHTVIGTGSAAGSLDVANILKPPMSRGELQIIGATTFNEYRENIEKDGALERRFHKITVEPTTINETKEILMNSKNKFEKHHHVKYSEEVIDHIIKLSNQYITDRFFPDKAIDILDEVGSSVLLNNSNLTKDIDNLRKNLKTKIEEKQAAVSRQDFEAAGKLLIEENKLSEKILKIKNDFEDKLKSTFFDVQISDVDVIVSKMTGIPVEKVGADEVQKLMNMEKTLENKIIGQKEAIISLSQAVRRARAGLKDPKQPIGSFMFLGPTGVGKTQIAKEIAKFLFDSEDAMFRLDMSEYKMPHEVAKLIGSPPGFVNHEEGGQLTEKVRRKPYCVVLLDEIEKAHSDVYNILLQMLDDGVLTDGKGRKVDFKNTIIIMTSNLGVKDLKLDKSFGFGDNQNNYSNLKEAVTSAMKEKLPPEFINRIDETVIFDYLTKNDLDKILDLILKETFERIPDLSFELDKSSRDFLLDKGTDQIYGARPLKRTVKKYVVNPLSDLVLLGKINGVQTVKISLDKENEKLNFSMKTKKIDELINA